MKKHKKKGDKLKLNQLKLKPSNGYIHLDFFSFVPERKKKDLYKEL